jgi:gliding motility-associated-like protein
MDKFEDIIKQKVEQFEPKFNEAHWHALDQKLSAIKKTRTIRNSVLSVAAVIVAVVSVFVIYNETAKDKENNKTQLLTNAVVSEEQSSDVGTESIDKKNIAESPKENKVTILPADEVKLEKLEIDHAESLNQKSETKVESVVKEEIEKPIKNASEQITAGFFINNSKVCLGEEISFEPNDKKELLAYMWDFGDGTYSSKINPKQLYKQAGVFAVSLIVINKKTGEEAKTIQNITILSLPNVDFTYIEQSTQFDDNKLKYPTTIFSCKGEGSDVYEWSFSNAKTSREKQPAILFDKKGDYQVSLKVKNINGCSNFSTKNITILNSFELFAPNAFTPNFDGNNDEFMPEALTTWDIKFEMIIKNKSGNVIFKTTDKNNAWNGSLNNQGNVLDEGVYLWQVITYDVNGKPYQHAGKINLLK